MPQKKSQEEVIAAFQSVHEHRYDYSKVRYQNSTTKVEVVCHQHGAFFVAPGHHANGVGCRKCYFDRQKTSRAEFIEISRQHFGDRYDYSLISELPPAGGKVSIRCLAHDLVFQQEFRNHQRGHVGCPQCISLKHALDMGQLTPELSDTVLRARFQAQAQSVHGDKYQYDAFQYVNSGVKGVIRCSEHGPFEQTPSNHLRGTGCPQCAKVKRSEGTFKQRCKELGIDYWRALKRRQGGMPDERIQNQGTLRGSREVGPITVNNVKYPNIEEAVRSLKPPASSKTIFRWIAKGMTAEDAFTRVPNPGYGNGIIYLVTHLNSGRQYVGITVQTLSRRWQQHLQDAKSGEVKGEESLHAAIRTFGNSAFNIEQIDRGTSKGTLEAKEREWIQCLNTLAPSGFNISPGGTSGGSNPRTTVVDSIQFPSSKAATDYVARTRGITYYAAAARIRQNRIDVKSPPKRGEGIASTSAYKTWSRLIHGVTNSRSKAYIQGVEIYPAWRTFDAFLSDIGHPPQPSMAFARLDKTRGYVPGNCIWMTKSEASKVNAAYMKAAGLLTGRRRKK
ncbi:GIY-YIG nuclease family protein [Rhodoferax bucti]|uniref:GIY-YIG nuclease family protein n=1 Tax=Rhodoferax bucti TaxID=2576305 RepID=UPI00110868CE|nr:GIY-YIG nuclease family protein [Rhodoferax bucti]